MIAFISGVVAEVGEVSVVLEVNGVGFEVVAPSSTLAKCTVGERLRLRTQLIFRDEQPSLYGFHRDEELLIFRRLLDVTGIGPKLALAILSALPTAVIVTAINNQDEGLLTAAPGVGKRTAARIVLELKDRLPPALEALMDSSERGKVLVGAGDDAVAALLALGYRENQVKGVVAELVTANPGDAAEALIRKALAKLR